MNDFNRVYVCSQTICFLHVNENGMVDRHFMLLANEFEKALAWIAVNESKGELIVKEANDEFTYYEIKNANSWFRT